MPATVTYKTLLEEVSEQTGVGYVLPTVTGTTSQFTLANAYGSGPWANRFPRGSPILTTAGTAINEVTYVDNHTPSSGVTTVTPAPSNTWTDGILFKLNTGIDHPDRVKEAVNRALTERCYRLEMRPLTYVPDGDLQGTTASDYWTAAANGTAAYAAAQVFPAGSAADAFGQVGVNRLLQLTTDAVGASTLTGNGMRFPLSTSQRTWYFLTAIRLVSGTGTAELRMRDNTNTADITLQVTRGNDDNELTITTLGDFMICEGTFRMPATCAEVAPQLVLSAASMVMQMTPIIMFPYGVTSFPMPNRIRSIEHIGNFYESLSSYNPSALGDMVFGDPLTESGRTHSFIDNGDHLTVAFNFRPTSPIWYQEAVFGSALTAMTDTTTFPRERVTRWAKFELYKYLAERDPTTLDPSKRPVVSPWVRKANSAKRAAEYSGYEPTPVTVVGRR